MLTTFTSHSSASEEELFYQALRRDDPKAWERLYLDSYKKFIPYARQRSSISEADAEDILQEALAEVSLKVRDGRYVFQGKPINAYAFTVCRNNWLTFLRKHKLTKLDTYKESTKTDDDEYMDIETESSETEEELVPELSIWGDEEVEADLEALELAQKELNKDCQTLIHYFYVEEKTLAECGILLGIQEGSAKVKRFRCTQRFRDLYLNYRKKTNL
ncbi:MAG: sigma-70 family RNA polymerase sigma factor [Siphonobacter sp.]